MISTSVVDSPKKSTEDDLFEIEKYQNGLINFIKNASSPLTVALQGEWGSGKTSLMNSMQMSLCGEIDVNSIKTNESEFYGIWLNTWQYSLMNSKDETLTSIITSLCTKIELINKYRHDSTSDKVSKAVKGFLKKISLASARYVAEKITDGGSEIVDSALNEENEITIFHLKNELQESIDDCIKKDIEKNTPKKGFIFFIDDLDRIDPPVAVEILELLKNIFDLNHCIFVLAIDYDVVVKGLEPKFGPINPKNEREFRSFFDKIIQMPFSMPISSYVIDKFLKSNLKHIDYFTETELESEENLKALKNIAMWTVGSNPRSLKRLINSLSLIKCINNVINTDDTKENELLEKIINFALVGIQISYPVIYNLLVKDSAFDNWNEHTALQLNLAALDEETKMKLSKSDEFNDDWEQVVFRICENEIYLQKNSLNISRLLNYLIKYCKENKEPNVGEIIGTVISLSSITNLVHNDQAQLEYHRGDFLKTIRWKVIQKLKPTYPLIQNQGARVQTNAYIKFQEDDWGKWIQLHSNPENGGIRLQIITHSWFLKTKPTLIEELKNVNKHEEFYGLEKQMKSLLSSFGDKVAYGFDWTDPDFIDIGKGSGNIEYHRFYFYNYVQLSTPSEFYTEQSIEMISEIISEMYKICVAFDKIKAELKNG